jgi:hypothetical protein
MDILTNVLATNALDGSEDNVFQDADNDDDPFEDYRIVSIKHVCLKNVSVKLDLPEQ